jgi:hypothetical protein
MRKQPLSWRDINANVVFRAEYAGGVGSISVSGFASFSGFSDDGTEPFRENILLGGANGGVIGRVKDVMSDVGREKIRFSKVD